MWFLVKTSFWFSAVLIALPLLDNSPETGTNAPPIAISETLAAAAIAYEDIKAMCDRHPDVCDTGSATLSALGMRARDGAHVAYQYLDATFGETAVTAEIAAPPALADLPEAVATAPVLGEAADPLATGTVVAPAETGIVPTPYTAPVDPA